MDSELIWKTKARLSQQPEPASVLLSKMDISLLVNII